MKRSKYISLLFLPALMGCTNRYATAETDQTDIPHDSLTKLCIRENYPYDTIPCDALKGVSPLSNELQDQSGNTYHRIGSPERREVVARHNLDAKPKIETENYTDYSSSEDYYYTTDGGSSSSSSSGYYSSHSNTVYYLNTAERNAQSSRRGGFGSRASSGSYSSSGGGFFSSGS
jgi:hypothetical protein